MKLFKLNQGPWSLLFEGRFQEMPLTVYTNPDKVILVLILDMGKTKPKGAVTQLHYPFMAEGFLENIIESLPYSASVLEKHAPNETSKFLMLSTEPAYLDWKEEKFQKEFSKMLKSIKSTGKAAEDFAKGFEVKLTAIGNMDKETQNAFLTEPILVPGLAAKLPKGKKGKTKGEIQVVSTNVPFGVDKAQNLVEEPFSMFKTTMVTDGDIKNRTQTLHMLAENSLLAGTSLTAFEWGNEFDGLSTATPDPQALTKAKIDLDPVGFPVKHFYPKKEVTVDIIMINPLGLMQLFGVADKDVIKFFQEKIAEKEYKNMQELIGSVKASRPAAGLNQFQINRLARVLELVQDIYPGLFDGKNPIDEIAKHWTRAIGRAGIIHLKDFDQRSALMLLHSIIKGILIKHREGDYGKGLKAMIMLPQAQKILGQNDDTLLGKELVDFLTELSSYGVGFIMESPHAIDLKKELADNIDAQFTLVRGLDAAVKIKGARGFRLKVRPTLSASAQ